MIDSKYVRSLIYLNGKTITSIALEAGIDPTNLSRALKGHSTVSGEKMEKVLEHLGVDPVTGTLKPIVHRWRFNRQIVIELLKLLPDLLPGGGEIIGLALKRDEVGWVAMVGNNGARIILDHAIIIFEDGRQNSKVRLSEGPLPEWKESYRIITPSDLKKLIEDEALTPSEFDEILGLKYETPLSDGVSFAREDDAENAGWTWNLILKKAKEAGLKPEEVAKRLGL
jgi:transcriptional regulator with XRE-family HTH domain